jgi:pyruvate formate lyase activating enzyme
VLVPGLTDDDANVTGLAQFVAQLPNVERLEVLPFHQMGAYKWKERGLNYPLEGVEGPTTELVAHVQQIFRQQGCKVW